MAQQSIAPVTNRCNSLRFLILLLLLSVGSHRCVSGRKSNQAWAFFSASIATVMLDLVLTEIYPSQAALTRSVTKVVYLPFQMPVFPHAPAVSDAEFMPFKLISSASLAGKVPALASMHPLV